MFVVEMYRIPKPVSGYDVFDCPGSLWAALRQLGQGFGWVPSGTTPAPGQDAERVCSDEKRLEEYRATVPPNWEELAERLDEEARRIHEGAGKGRFSPFMGPGFEMRMKFSQLDLYEPRDWGGVVRMVSAEDAICWAKALELALYHMEELAIDLPHKGATIINRDPQAKLNTLMNGGLKRDFVRSFIGYLRRGSFGFAWDD